MKLGDKCANTIVAFRIREVVAFLSFMICSDFSCPVLKITRGVLTGLKTFLQRQILQLTQVRWRKTLATLLRAGLADKALRFCST
jgi:hypothetical protein